MRLIKDPQEQPTMHRTGYWIGMDLHDCGSHVEPSQVGQISERRDPLSNEIIKDRSSRILKPGMALTIEPGLYVRPAEGVPEAFHHIGIRIEGDALVTDADCELITRGVPVKADEIEALMQGGERAGCGQELTVTMVSFRGPLVW